MHPEPSGNGVTLDVIRGAHFAWSDDLVLIEEKDGYSGGGQQFIDLRPFSAQSGASVAIFGCLSDPVRFIEDQYIQSVALSLHERVEVLEDRCRPGLAETAHISQGLRKRPGPGGMYDGPPTRRQCPHQAQRDDTLPATRSPTDDHCRLVVAGTCLLDRMQDQIERDGLLVEQNELLARGEFVGDDGQQLA
jgi:hypothetical protein